VNVVMFVCSYYSSTPHAPHDRITNFGIKRTYVQVGFSFDVAAELTKAGRNEDSETGRNIEPEGPPKKKEKT
jgi:hypothetical protein